MYVIIFEIEFVYVLRVGTRLFGDSLCCVHSAIAGLYSDFGSIEMRAAILGWLASSCPGSSHSFLHDSLLALHSEVTFGS